MGYLSIKTHSANLSLRECSKGGVVSSEGAAPSPRRTDVRGAGAVIGANPPRCVLWERYLCDSPEGTKVRWETGTSDRTGEKRCESGAVAATNPHTFPRNRTDLNMHACERCPGARELAPRILHQSIWCLDHTEIHQESSRCLPVNCRNLPI